MVLLGFSSWIAFGVVELGFLALLPAMLRPAHLWVPQHVGFAVMVLALYGLFGGLSGVVLGQFRWNVLLSRPQSVATATVLVAYIATMMANLPEQFTARAGLLISPVLIAGAIWGPGHLRVLGNPWTASLMVLGSAWVASDSSTGHSRPVIATLVLGYLVLVFGASVFIGKLLERRLTVDLR